MAENYRINMITCSYFQGMFAICRFNNMITGSPQDKRTCLEQRWIISDSQD